MTKKTEIPVHPKAFKNLTFVERAQAAERLEMHLERCGDLYRDLNGNHHDHARR